MLRKTEFYECDDTEDLKGVLEQIKCRRDGGRTVIELTGDYYLLEKPLKFDVNDRVTINFNDLKIAKSDGGCVIRNNLL